MDDLLYQDRSQTSNDVLGLVTDTYVTIVDHVTNSTDVIIDASIFVRSGDFGADNYQSSGIRGRAYVVGSIVQATRGAVGTFASNGALKSGCLRSYRYDERLADPNFRPPFYPGFYKESFLIASWWESVRIPKYYRPLLLSRPKAPAPTDQILRRGLTVSTPHVQESPCGDESALFGVANVVMSGAPA